MKFQATICIPQLLSIIPNPFHNPAKTAHSNDPNLRAAIHPPARIKFRIPIIHPIALILTGALLSLATTGQPSSGITKAFTTAHWTSRSRIYILYTKLKAGTSALALSQQQRTCYIHYTERNTVIKIIITLEKITM